MDNTLKYYNQNANQFVQETITVDFKQTQNRFLSKLSNGAYILDFGCGSGRDAKYFREKGYQVDATDGSDELWNLMPMDSSLNSSKSNRLPKWNPFFIRFAKNQFIMYQRIHEKEGIRKLYESCYRDNLHSIWAGQELYRKGNSKEEFMNILQKNMQPVYDSARRQGYEVWNRG